MTFDKARVLLRAEAIEKSFRGSTVLDGISMDVHAGEVIALIGPSGAGKSTFLRCLNYLEQPTSGHLSLDGEPVFADPLKPSKSELLSLRRRVGMVFQAFNLFPHLSVMENVTMAQRLNGRRAKDEAEEYALKLLSQVGSRRRPRPAPPSVPAANNNASPSRERSPRTRRSCCSMNRPRRWTPRSATTF